RMSAAHLRAVDPDEHREPDDDGNAWDGQFDVEAKEDSAPWLEPGLYDAIVIRGNVRTYKWSDKQETRRLVLQFEIVNHRTAGTKLEFICALPRKVGGKSKFMRAWEVANGGPAKRRDRLKLSVFRHRMFQIEVGDVELDRARVKLTRRYSIVKRLL